MHAETPTPVTKQNLANVDRRPQKEKRAEIWLPGCPSLCMFCANVSSGNPMLTQLRVKLLPFSRYRNVPGHELDHRGNTQSCSCVSQGIFTVGELLQTLCHTIGLKYIPNKTIVYNVTYFDVFFVFLYEVYHLFQQNYEYVSLTTLPHKLPVSKSFKFNSVKKS